jgi:hypothetical protein
MFRALMNRVAGSRRPRSRRSPAQRPRLARPAVEPMETRLVPSTSALPVLAAPHPDSTGGTPGVVSAEMVCGYKHRGPCRPHVQTLGQSGAMPQGPAITAERLSYIQGETAHLVIGGADGPLVAISGNGHFVPPPPPVPWLFANESFFAQ